MAPRTRDRFPLFWGNVQLTLRLCTLGTAIACLCFLVKLASTYKDANRGQGKTFGGAIFTSSWAVVISFIEAVPLLDYTHRIKRAPGMITGFADLVILGVGMYSLFEVLLSDFALADAPTGYQTPWRHLQDMVVILVIIIVIEAAIALLLGCICGCRDRKRGTHGSSGGQRLTVLNEYS